MAIETEDDFDRLSRPPVYQFRGLPVLVDTDVAALFEVETRRLNEQVKRNFDRFDGQFAFQLTDEEFDDLKSQNATSSDSSHGGRRTRPWMFTEAGVVMAATVLRTERAIVATRFVVRVFVEARRNQLATAAGRNTPAAIDSRAVLPLEADRRRGLSAKLDDMLGKVLETIADPEKGTTVGDEARAVALEGLNALKEHLRRQGVENQRTLADVQKTLKEAEKLDAVIASQRIENQHRQLAYRAKQLRMLIEAQRYLETGSVEGLLAVLADIERA